MRTQLQEKMNWLAAVIDLRLDWMKSKIREERGASTVEYALVIAVIVFGVVGAATLIFDPLKGFFADIIDKIYKLAMGK